MGKAKKIALLVADTAFLPQEYSQQYCLISAFPYKTGDGAARFSYEELLFRSKAQSRYYNRLAPAIAEVLQQHIQVETSYLAQLVRPVLVTLTSLFLDRSLRVIHRLRQCPAGHLRVASVSSLGTPESLDGISGQMSNSWRLNQAIIGYAATALGVPREQAIPPEHFPEYPRTSLLHNYLSAPPREGIYSYLNRAINRLFIFVRGLNNPKAKYVSLGFSGDDYYLTRRGLYGPFGIFRNHPKQHFPVASINLGLRNLIFEELSALMAQSFCDLLHEVNATDLDTVQLHALGMAYVRFCLDCYPTSFLEGLARNIAIAKENIRSCPGVSLIGTNLVSDDGYYYAMAIKMTGGKVIGAQHAGHYGYTEDMSLVTEFEYDLCDYMLTWGWREFEPEWPSAIPIPVPAPRLSEKPINGKHIRYLMNASNRVSDVLFMSNLLHRFPHISTCGPARIDFIDQILSFQKNLVRTITSAGYKLDYKPYNQWTVDFLDDFYRELEQIGNGRYRLMEPKQKGLSPSLLKGRRLVLWDQLGTGALDCLTANIPCMIVWPRIYSRESRFSIDAIRELSEVGIVHSTVDSLIEELHLYLAGPHAWMENATRRQAIRDFCRLFAWTDDNWATTWRRKLNALSLQ